MSPFEDNLRRALRQPPGQLLGRRYVARQRLDAGEPILVFPEGQRTRDLASVGIVDGIEMANGRGDDIWSVIGQLPAIVRLGGLHLDRREGGDFLGGDVGVVHARGLTANLAAAYDLLAAVVAMRILGRVERLELARCFGARRFLWTSVSGNN